MEEIKRRRFTKAAGASLLGVTTTGISTAAPANEGITLLEVALGFDFGDAEDLHFNHSDRPIKYALDPNERRLQILNAPEEERRVFANSDRVVDFQGAKGDATTVGGTRVHTLDRRSVQDATQGVYVRSEAGYDVPEFEIDWEANAPDNLLRSPAIRDVSVDGQFVDLSLPTAEIDVATKVVHDERVDRPDIPRWRRAKKTEFSTKTVEAEPYLSVAAHRGLDVVVE